MGFRKEMRAFVEEARQFMKDYYNWRKRKDVTNNVLKDVIRDLQEERRELLDRLLARDLPELKTFTLPSHEATPEEYNPLEDEANAGEVIDVPEN